MNRLKTFSNVFWKSLTNPSYYKKIASTKFSFSLKYLFFLLFLISLGWGIFFSVKLAFYLPKVPEFIAQVKSVARGFYPAELVVVIKDGKLQTYNVSEPYFIDFPKELRETELHFITIDTKARFEDIKRYNTAVLVTGDTIFYVDDPGYKTLPISQIKNDLLLNRNVYDQFVDRILPYLDYLSTAVYVLIITSLLIWPFLGAGLALIGQMVYLLFTSVILWIVARVLKKDLTYGKIYQLSMHALSLPIIFSTISGLFKVQIPFVYPGLLIVFMIIVIAKFERKPSIEQVSAQE